MCFIEGDLVEFVSSSTMSISPLRVAGLAVVSYLGLRYLQSKNRGGTAPGPPGLPIIGVGVPMSLLASFSDSIRFHVFYQNALDVPTKDEWLTYCEWGKKYGKHTRHYHGSYVLTC